MKRKKLFQTTAVLHPNGELEVMGGPMRHVRYEAAKYPGARAIVVREVLPKRKRPSAGRTEEGEAQVRAPTGLLGFADGVGLIVSQRAEIRALKRRVKALRKALRRSDSFLKVWAPTHASWDHACTAADALAADTKAARKAGK